MKIKIIVIFLIITTLIIQTSGYSNEDYQLFEEKNLYDIFSEIDEQFLINNISDNEDVGWFTSLCLDLYNNPHISYYDYGNGDLKYAYNSGSNWTIETVDSEGIVGYYTSIILDEYEFPHISYQDYENKNLKYAFWNGTCWNIDVVDDDGSVGYYTSICLDRNNNPHISYTDGTNNDLKYAYLEGDNWIIQSVDTAGAVGYFPSLDLDENNNPHISYYDYGNGDLKYAKYVDDNWNIQTIDTGGDVGWYTSLELDSDGNPHISYVDWSNWNLKYVFFNGSNWIKEIVDAQGDVRKWTSLDLDENNHPHISYYDYTDGALRYTHKNEDLWNKETIDSYGSVGCFNSLKLDSDNNPYISYYDWGMASLKYAYWNEINWDIQYVDLAESQDILDQKQIYCSGWSYGTSKYVKLAQSFKPTLKLLTRVEITLVKRGNPNGITVSIRDNLSGEDLTSVYIDANYIESDMSWNEFNFPDIIVNTNQTYYIIAATDGESSNDYFYWYFGTYNPYENGSPWSNSGQNWEIFILSSFPDLDFVFKTYGHDNIPPSIPNKPIGPLKPIVKKPIIYSTCSNDSDGDMIYYKWDWGDGIQSDWLGPYPSGLCYPLAPYAIHSWFKPRSYEIRVKAKDSYGLISDWSDSSIVYVTNIFKIK